MVQMDLLKKVGLVLVILVSLSYVGYKYVLIPKKERIRALDKSISKVTLEIEKTKKFIKKVELLEREVEQLDRKFEVMKSVLPTKEELPGLIRKISQLGYHNRINYTLFKPGKETVVKDKGYAKFVVDLEFRASYANIKSLIRGFSSMNRLIKPVTMRVSYARKGLQRSPTLGVKCTLETYRYLSSLSRGESVKKR
jgi:Tfp pilus assembly protein PilO